MEKFFSEIGSLYWWISVVVIGLAINIIASSGYKYLDRVFSGYFEKWKQTKQKEKDTENKEIDSLKVNEFDQIVHGIFVLFSRLSVIIFLLLAVLYLLIIILMYSADLQENLSVIAFKVLQVPAFLVIIFSMILSLRFLKRSRKGLKMLSESRKKIT